MSGGSMPVFDVVDCLKGVSGDLAYPPFVPSVLKLPPLRHPDVVWVPVPLYKKVQIPVRTQ